VERVPSGLLAVRLLPSQTSAIVNDPDSDTPSYSRKLAESVHAMLVPSCDCIVGYVIRKRRFVWSESQAGRTRRRRQSESAPARLYSRHGTGRTTYVSCLHSPRRAQVALNSQQNHRVSS
jgi:hypothetical protein